MNFKKFLLEAFTEYKRSSWTYNHRRKNLKIFCDFLLRKGLLAENPFTNIKKRKEEKPLPKYLNTSQI